MKENGGGTRRLAAVKSGEIKATALNEPITSHSPEHGVNVLVDLVAEQIPVGVQRRRGSSRRHRHAPRLITRFLKATIEGNYLALTDERRAKETLAKELKLTDQKSSTSATTTSSRSRRRTWSRRSRARKT